MSAISTTMITEEGGFGRPASPQRDTPVVCAGCGRSVPRKARQQIYCSARCRLVAFREREPNGGLETHEVGAGSGPGKITAIRPNRSENLQQNQSPLECVSAGGRSWAAPAHVLETELDGGRTWRTVTSSGGVVSQVSTLRGRALQNGGGR
jgi:hypothetical protein